MISHKTTLDELGDGGNIELQVEIFCELSVAEPDSHDTPGLPDELTLVNVIVLEVTRYNAGVGAFHTSLRKTPDLQARYDKVACEIVADDWEKHSEEILEHADGLREAMAEGHWVSKRELKEKG